MMSEKENTGNPVSNDDHNGDGPTVYGYIVAMTESNPPGPKRVFGIGKNVINMGRGSRNDIRLNARMFSRLHVTLTITEEEDDLLKVELKNQSQQKNATRAPYVLPLGNSVLLDSPGIFQLQGRRFQWIGNRTEEDQEFLRATISKCSEPITYIWKDKSLQEQGDAVSGSNVVEYPSSPKSQSEGNKSTKSSPSRKRRSSVNASLELRKAAIKRSFRSSLQQQMNQSAPSLRTVMEDTDGDEDEEEDHSRNKSCDLILFSPPTESQDEVATPEKSYPSLIDLRSPASTPEVNQQSQDVSFQDAETQRVMSPKKTPVARVSSPAKSSTVEMQRKSTRVSTPFPTRSTRSSVATEMASANLSNLKDALPEEQQQSPSSGLKLSGTLRISTRRASAMKLPFADVSTINSTISEEAEDQQIQDESIHEAETQRVMSPKKTPVAKISSPAKINTPESSRRSMKVSSPVPTRSTRSSVATEMTSTSTSNNIEEAVPLESTPSGVKDPVTPRTSTRRSSMIKLPFADVSTMNSTISEEADELQIQNESTHDVPTQRMMSPKKTPMANGQSPAKINTPKSSRKSMKVNSPVPTRSTRSSVANEMTSASTPNIKEAINDESTPSSVRELVTPRTSTRSSMMKLPFADVSTMNSTIFEDAEEQQIQDEITDDGPTQRMMSPKKTPMANGQSPAKIYTPESTRRSMKVSSPAPTRSTRSSVATELASTSTLNIKETGPLESTPAGVKESSMRRSSVMKLPFADVSAINSTFFEDAEEQQSLEVSLQDAEAQLVMSPKKTPVAKVSSPAKSSTGEMPRKSTRVSTPLQTRSARSSVATEMVSDNLSQEQQSTPSGVRESGTLRTSTRRASVMNLPFADVSTMNSTISEEAEEQQSKDESRLRTSTRRSSMMKLPFADVSKMNSPIPEEAEEQQSQEESRLRTSTKRASMMKLTFANVSTMNSPIPDEAEEQQSKDESRLRTSTRRASVMKLPFADVSTMNSTISEDAEEQQGQDESRLRASTKRASMMKLPFADVSTMNSTISEEAEEVSSPAKTNTPEISRKSIKVNSPVPTRSTRSSMATEMTCTPCIEEAIPLESTPTGVRESATPRTSTRRSSMMKLPFADVSTMNSTIFEDAEEQQSKDESVLSAPTQLGASPKKTPMAKGQSPGKTNTPEISRKSLIMSSPVPTRSTRSSVTNNITTTSTPNIKEAVPAESTPTSVRESATPRTSTRRSSMMKLPFEDVSTMNSTISEEAEELQIQDESTHDEPTLNETSPKKTPMANGQSPAKHNTPNTARTSTKRVSMMKLPFADVSTMNSTISEEAEDVTSPAKTNTPEISRKSIKVSSPVPTRSTRSSVATEMAFTSTPNIKEARPMERTPAGVKVSSMRRSSVMKLPFADVSAINSTFSEEGEGQQFLDESINDETTQPETSLNKTPMATGQSPAKTNTPEMFSSSMNANSPVPTRSTRSSVANEMTSTSTPNIKEISLVSTPSGVKESSTRRSSMMKLPFADDSAINSTFFEDTEDQQSQKVSLQDAETQLVMSPKKTPVAKVSLPANSNTVKMQRNSTRGVPEESAPMPTTSEEIPKSPRAKSQQDNVETSVTEKQSKTTRGKDQDGKAEENIASSSITIAQPKATRGKRLQKNEEASVATASLIEEQPKPTRGRRFHIAVASVSEIEKQPKTTRGKRLQKNEEVSVATASLIEEQPKATRGKRLQKNEEVSVAPASLIEEQPKPTRGKRLQKNQEDAVATVSVIEEQPKTTRGKRLQKNAEVSVATASLIEEQPKATRGKRQQKNEEVSVASASVIEEQPKTTRGKRLQKNEEVSVASTSVTEEQPKSTRGKRLQKSEQDSVVSASVTEEQPKTTRGKRLQKKKEDNVATASLIEEQPKTTRGKRLQKNEEVSVASASVTEEQPKTTRGKRLQKKNEDNVASASVIEEQPKTTRGKRLQKNEEVSVASASVIEEQPKPTRGKRLQKNEEDNVASATSASVVEEQPKTTRGKRLQRNVEESETSTSVSGEKPKSSTRGKRQRKNAEENIATSSITEGEPKETVASASVIEEQPKPTRGKRLQKKEEETVAPTSVVVEPPKTTRGKRLQRNAEESEASNLVSVEKPKSTTRGKRQRKNAEENIASSSSITEEQPKATRGKRLRKNEEESAPTTTTLEEPPTRGKRLRQNVEESEAAPVVEAAKEQPKPTRGLQSKKSADESSTLANIVVEEQVKPTRGGKRQRKNLKEEVIPSTSVVTEEVPAQQPTKPSRKRQAESPKSTSGSKKPSLSEKPTRRVLRKR